MAAPKFTKQELVAVKSQIDEMDLWGYTPSKIAEKVGIRPPTVIYHLRGIHRQRRRLVEEARKNKESLIAQKYFQYERQAQEVYEAWKRSQEDAWKKTTEEYVDKEGVPHTKECTTLEGQSGDPRFQTLIKQCRDAQRELLGLDAPKQTESKNLHVHTAWDNFALAENPDLLEEKLTAIEEGKVDVNGEILDEIAPPEDPEDVIEYGLKELDGNGEVE